MYNELLEKKIFENVKKKNKIVRKIEKTDKLDSYYCISSWCDRIGDVRCDSAAYTDNGNVGDEH